MPPRRQHLPRAEWVFLTALTLLCAALTALQYRWTGDLARTESARLRAALGEQVQSLCHAFDAELTGSCAQLLPARGEELEGSGRETVHAARWRTWRDGHPRPIFRRVAVAVPVADGVELLALDPRDGQLAPAPWPPEWVALRQNLRGKRGPGRVTPPFEDPTGTLLEFPVHGGFQPPRAGPAESEWLILELDADYLRDHWLPELIREHLNPGPAPLHAVEVHTLLPPTTRLFSTELPGNAATDADGKPFSLPFNRQGRGTADPRSPGGDFRWTLAARPRTGAMDAAVAVSRRRNLALAVGVNALILVAGILLSRHTRRARRLAEAEMNFVANVSHELRTPLTVIRGAAHNLQRGIVQDPARVAEYAGLINAQAGQLAEMVEQVLTFAGARRERSPATRRPVALDAVVREAITEAEPDTRATRCRVELELPASLPTVSGDAAALRRAFQNLVTNAAKHGGAGGWIGVTARATNGQEPPSVEVEIADRGPGVPAGEQKEIFQPFVRGAAARTGQVRGSGIGLSLVREIVEAHGGLVSVHSAAGQGAVFRVRLPVLAGPTMRVGE